MAHVLTKFFIGPSVGSNNTDIFHTRLNVMGKNKGFSDEYSDMFLTSRRGFVYIFQTFLSLSRGHFWSVFQEKHQFKQTALLHFFSPTKTKFSSV